MIKARWIIILFFASVLLYTTLPDSKKNNNTSKIEKTSLENNNNKVNTLVVAKSNSKSKNINNIFDKKYDNSNDIIRKKALLRLNREKRKNLVRSDWSPTISNVSQIITSDNESQQKNNQNKFFNNNEIEFFDGNKDNLETNNNENENKNLNSQTTKWWDSSSPKNDNFSLKTNTKKQNWWEVTKDDENILLLKNTNTNSNWWEKPNKNGNINKSNDSQQIPWWLDNQNSNDFDKLILVTQEDEHDYDITLFDLYLGDQQIGLVLVNYTDKWFEIPEPDDLIEQLTGVKNPSKIAPLIKGTIKNYRNVAGIGDITLDRDSFKLLLNIDKKNLTETQLAINKLIENPVNAFSLENRVSYMTSGNVDENTSNNSFSHKTLASYGKHFLLTQGYINDENNYELQELNLGTIVDKYSVKGGFLQNRGNNFIPSLNILGMKVETEEQLFIDSDLTKGSKIEVFIPSTAKVLFYKNNILIDYQILNYGLQEIDTTRFPQGSYNVDIEIREYNGKVTRERQFFTKSGLIASRDRPVYYTSLGSARNETDIIEVPVVEAGVRVRTNDFMETEGSIFATESIAIASSSIRGLWKDYYFDIGAGVSNDGDLAFNTTLNTTFKDTFFSISWTEIPGDDDFVNEYTNDSKKDNFLYAASSIKNKRRTISANIQRGHDKITYGIQGSINTNTTRNKKYDHDSYDDNFFLITNDSYAVGPWFNVNLMRDGSQSLDFRTNYYFKKQEDNLNAQLLYNKKLDEKIYNNTSLSFNKEAFKYGKINNSLTYNNLNNTTNKGFDLGLDTEITKYDSEDDIPINNNLKLTYGNEYLYGTGNINNRFYKSSSDTSYGAAIQSSMILTEDGFGRIMTPQRSNSMVVINIQDQTHIKNNNNVFSVIINDMKFTEVKANTPTLISLSPYKTYKIRIESTEDSDLTEYDNKSKFITLFPGNIGEVVWNIKKVFVGIGVILDSDNNPIKHQKIKGLSDYVYTEDDGSFQANLAGDEKLYIKSSKYDCKIVLPKHEINDVVIDFGDIVCK